MSRERPVFHCGRNHLHTHIRRVFAAGRLVTSMEEEEEGEEEEKKEDVIPHTPDAPFDAAGQVHVQPGDHR